MTIAAINEELLRSIGVGIALCERGGFAFRFCNDVFADWFGRPDTNATLGDVFADLDLAAVEEAVESGASHRAEVRIKKRRRQLVMALTISSAPITDAPLLVVECQNITRIRELETMIDSYSSMVERNTRDLQREKERVEKLLLNVMPRPAYEEYKTFGAVSPQRSDGVGVVVLQFADFEARVAEGPTAALVGEINEIFSAFDRIGEQFGCERVKTTGDQYMAVVGLLEPGDDHAAAAWQTAHRFLRFLTRRNETHPSQWQARVGVAGGAVIGSVVGTQRYVYDVFGPAVTRATVLAQKARPQEILLDPAAADNITTDTLPSASQLTDGDTAIRVFV
ncbi:MAG: adenylate/guanylate cyclase domain-containing protein [Pseudomonadota bacterium]